MKQQNIGITWSFLSAFFWATVYVSSRYILGGGKPSVDPVTLSLIRFALGGSILFVLAFCFRRAELFSLTKRQLLKVWLLSQFSFVGMSVCLFFGQKHTGAINASMIMSAAPVLTFIIGACMGEKTTLRQSICMAFATVGCFFVIEVLSFTSFNLEQVGFGDLLVLGSALSWSIGTLLGSRILKGCNDFAVTVWSMLFAALSLLAIDLCCWESIVMPANKTVWIYVFYMAIFPTAIGFYAWYAALRRVSVNVVNVMQYLTPVMTVVMACVFLGEKINGPILFGIVLVLCGVIGSSIRGKQHEGRST